MKASRIYSFMMRCIKSKLFTFENYQVAFSYIKREDADKKSSFLNAAILALSPILIGYRHRTCSIRIRNV